MVSAGCTNFDQLVEQACASGRCGETINQTDPPALRADRATLDFGQFTSEARPKRRLVVSNSDGGLAESLTFNFMGAAADDFSATSSCSTLAVGQSCPADVEFVASNTTLGVRTAELLVRASRGDTLRVSLQAEVVSALTAPPVLDFGDVAVGTNKVLPLRVTNNLPRPATIAPTIPAPFFLDSNGCTTVGIGQSCDVNVRFEAAAQPGDDVERMMFLDIEQNRATVSLRARAVATGQLRLEPTALFASDAGAAVEKGTVRDIAFTVTNLGAQPIKSIGYDLTATPAWSVVDAGCAALGPSQSCQGVLRFSPTSLTFHPATLVADAGVIGDAATSGVGRGVGLAQLEVTVDSRDSGLEVVQSLDGGRCVDRCTWSAWTDPSGPTVVWLTTQEHPLYNAPKFTPRTNTCDRLNCTLPLDRELLSVSVSRDRLPIAFVTAQACSGAFPGGIVGADSVCQAEAGDAGLPGAYRALLNLANGSAGALRFDAGTYVWPYGAVAIQRQSDGGFGAPRGHQYAVWSGEPYGGIYYTCSDWTGTTGFNGSFWQGGGTTLQASTCAAPLRLLCLSIDGTNPERFDGAPTMFAAATSGLGVNFYSECEAAGAMFGLGYVRPYVARSNRPACRSFVAEDGGAEDAGLYGSLYRVDGQRMLLSAQALQSCSPGSPPALFLPVGWAVTDAGVVPADSRPVRTIGEGYSLFEVASSTNCANWTSVAPAPTYHRNYGDATATATDWWARGNYVGCNVASYIYCVGHR